jgi:hypothetical protein
MKKLIMGLFLVCAFGSVKSQVDSAITFKEVVTVDSVAKSELFSRARIWFEKTFKDSKAVISINDKETGELAGKGIMHFRIAYQGRDNTMIPVTVGFRCLIQTKDGKYRYEFTDFEVIEFWNQISDIGIIGSEQGKDWFGTKKWSKIAYEESKAEVEKNTALLIISLKSEMAKGNNW